MPPRLGSLTVGGRVLWRQIAAAPAAAVTIFVATLLAALFVTAVPRILELVSAEDLRESLIEAVPEKRNIRAETHGRLGPGSEDAPFSHVRERGESVSEEGFPESVKSVVADSQYLVESAQFQVSSFPGDVQGPFPTFFRFRFQEGIEEEVTLVSGDLPDQHLPIPMLVGESCPEDPLAVEGFEPDPDVDCQVVDVPVFEAALTAGTAEAMEVGIGDRVFITPDAQDPLWPFGSIESRQPRVLVISGIIELSDLSEEFWFADAALHRPRIEENPDFRLIYGTGLMAPQAYRQMLTVFEPAEFAYTWRYFVDPALVDAREVEILRADLDRILPPLDETVITLLPSLITEYLEQRALTVQLMSTAVAGLAVAAVGVVLVLAGLIAERHSRGTVLIRDRGASRGQLTLTSAYAGLLLVGPAALLGFLTTTSAVAGTDGLASGRASAALAAGGTAAVMVAASPYVHRRLGTLRRLDAQPEANPGRRLVLEVFLLVAAVASAVLLRRRGMADTPTVPEGRFDTLLALAPALIGIAVGIVVVRLLAPLMRMSSWLSSRGRALVAFIGFRRLVSMPSVGRAPILVILLAVAVAVFSTVLRSSIAVGQEEHGWHTVGADFRVDGQRPGLPLPQTVDADTLADGMPWAEAVFYPGVGVVERASSPDVAVLATDVTAHLQVLAGSATDAAALDILAATTHNDPIPVVVSRHWGNEASPAVGTEFNLQLGAVDPRVVVAGSVERFPTLSLRHPFVVMRLDDLREVNGDLPVPATTIFLRAPETETSRLASMLAPNDLQVELTSRYQVEDALVHDPFASWVDRGLAAVFYLGIGFAVVAAVSLLTVTAAHRRRDLGLLRTMGLGSGAATAITALEQIPPVVLATLAGVASGSLAARVLSPALDTESFTGSLLPGEILIDLVPLAAVTGAVMIVLGLAVASFVYANREEDYGGLLKVGDE